MSADVRIMTDPAPITSFKTKVLPIIMAGCASAGCHGGTHAGTFQLYIGQSPTQLYSTGYGRDLMLKASLLLPILVLARRNLALSRNSFKR